MAVFKRALLTFVRVNQALSLWIDCLLLPDRLRKDGNETFQIEILPNHVSGGLRVYDLGGGSQPYFCRDQKSSLGLHVTGLDISHEQLEASPEGAYDQKIVADLCTFQGSGDADLVICQATLEHVPDMAGAIRAIGETLAPGGKAVLFLPCRNAVFARLNLLLPEALKKRLLSALFPNKKPDHTGFKAYYNRCTPRDVADLACQNRLEVEELQFFWISSYFTIFTPVFLLWRLYQGLAYMVIGTQASETFTVTLVKK